MYYFEKKDISKIDLENSFFHYTSKNNLKTIFEKGLEPRIGNNSIYVEKTPKIFFCKGEKGILTIMDVWLRWLTSKYKVNKFIYWLGTFYMRMPICIKSIPNSIVKLKLKSEKQRKKVYLKMKDILDNCVFLILDLKEHIDFDYNDIDEVKNTYYNSFLQLLYPNSSNLNDHKMEYWNMHTYTNKVIENDKISILEDDSCIIASRIVKKLIDNNIEYVKNNCVFLYEYYVFIYS